MAPATAVAPPAVAGATTPSPNAIVGAVGGSLPSTPAGALAATFGAVDHGGNAPAEPSESLFVGGGGLLRGRGRGGNDTRRDVGDSACADQVVHSHRAERGDVEADRRAVGTQACAHVCAHMYACMLANVRVLVCSKPRASMRRAAHARAHVYMAGWVTLCLARLAAPPLWRRRSAPLLTPGRLAARGGDGGGRGGGQLRKRQPHDAAEGPPMAAAPLVTGRRRNCRRRPSPAPTPEGVPTNLRGRRHRGGSGALCGALGPSCASRAHATRVAFPLFACASRPLAAGR